MEIIKSNKIENYSYNFLLFNRNYKKKKKSLTKKSGNASKVGKNAK